MLCFSSIPSDAPRMTLYTATSIAYTFLTMADPFSIVAGAFSLVDITGRLADQVNTLVRSIRNAPKELSEFSNELNMVKEFLAKAEAMYLSTRQEKRATGADLDGQFITILGRAKLCLNEIDQFMKPLWTADSQRTRPSLNRTTWARQKKKMTELLGNLRNIRRDLHLIWDMDARYVTSP